jgi:hypothetical protein
MAITTDLLSVIYCTKYPNLVQQVRHLCNFLQGKNFEVQYCKNGLQKNLQVAQGTKYPCDMCHHVVYLGPLGSIAQNVLERVTECMKQ